MNSCQLILHRIILEILLFVSESLYLQYIDDHHLFHLYYKKKLKK